ncbi:polysaccharide deacetylase family protein [Lutibaculum baratangense]|uniref:Chitooligosaccharide deacetylase n=1 Tax=Lutibaculum baratangense AMV1 TaxID=631454 RepID=V4RJ41_9HYPH|nr:polysaccharide deacetylase family protein [Lutibaculum baratangense]ESR23290.1 uncharacterized protein N177_3358 [Lutibaculum baratangense AMV1]
MDRRRTALLQAGLKTLYYTGAHKVLAPLTRGEGIIFTLHHIVPGEPEPFSPNRILAITPEFLSAVIGRVKASGLEIVSLDEMRRRLLEPPENGRRFACFTIDDGYRDNLVHAHPVFERHEVPYAIYVMTGLVERNVALWWRTLEKVVSDREEIVARIDGQSVTLPARSLEEKYAAYEKIYWHVRSLGGPERASAVTGLAAEAGIDERALARDMGMSWDEVRRLNESPLVTIGAHTLTHPALAQMSEADASYEMAESRRIIGEELGERPRHFAYPYGNPAAAGRREFQLAQRLGFATAVTTRPGIVYREHAGALWSLPRVSLNGDYQNLKFLDLFLSGAPFALANRFRKVSAA